MGAADLLALADCLRNNADTMELYWKDPRQIQVIRDCADDLDREAYRLVSTLVEAAA